VSVGFYALKWLLNKGYSKGMLICGSLILAGALGNLLDSMFYGLIFSDSPYSCFSGNYNSIHDLLQNPNKDAIAHFTSFGHGYGKFLQGKVVDMFYFPVIETTLPGWVPFWGGRSFTFFEPVFNLADAAISVGIFTLLLFQKRLMDQPKTTQPPVATETQA
jgi:signal peptidase II